MNSTKNQNSLKNLGIETKGKMKEEEKKGKKKKSFFNNEGSNSQGTWTTATNNEI